MKVKYLNELKDILVKKNVKISDINQIVSDYKELYEDGLEQGLSDQEIINKLGSPSFVYSLLKDDVSYRKNKSSKNGDWITGITVFIAIILFMVSGLVFDMWKYGWLFFLLIPITAIINNTNKKEMLPGLSIFIALIIFFILGFTLNLWHPGWLIFTIIPISGILTNTKTKDKIMGLLVFLTIIVYFSISYLKNSFYLYGWPIFLLIPLVGTIYIENKKIRIGAIITLLFSIIFYYVLSFYFNNWGYPLFLFVIPFGYGVITNQIQIEGIGFKNNYGLFFAILVLIIYILVSLATKSWHLTWLILLLIPMIGIYTTTKFKFIVAYMPFISLIIFFLVGFLIEGGFTYSWMAFFLIPITAILENRKPKKVIADEDDIELINLDE